MLGAPASLLLQLTLWAASVNAFFPFIPEGHCAPDEDCAGPGHGTKRSNVLDLPAEGGRGGVITVPVYHHHATIVCGFFCGLPVHLELARVVLFWKFRMNWPVPCV
jgi:hypothetical protein